LRASNPGAGRFENEINSDISRAAGQFFRLFSYSLPQFRQEGVNGGTGKRANYIIKNDV